MCTTISKTDEPFGSLSPLSTRNTCGLRSNIPITMIDIAIGKQKTMSKQLHKQHELLPVDMSHVASVKEQIETRVSSVGALPAVDS